MNVSILLRLVPAGLADGRICGQAEVVDTGETLVFRDEDEMLAFLRRAHDAPPDVGDPGGSGRPGGGGGGAATTRTHR